MTNFEKLRYRELVDRNNVDDFESAIGFEPLYKSGENDVGKCPMTNNHAHGDQTGKFAIHRGKKVYNCFKCGGGSLLSLVMELYDLDTEGATDWIRQYADEEARSAEHILEEFYEALQTFVKEKQKEIPYFNERVLEKYSDPTDWFEDRGISQEVIESYNLRCTKMTSKKAPIRNGERIDDDDYYGPAAIFPHYWHGKLVGWQNRWLEDPDTPKWLPKYTNTSDFPKSETLFNFDNVLETTEPIIVCESVPTVLLLASHGYPAVSFFGGKISETQLGFLRRFQAGIILAPDNDKPGEEFLRKATDYLTPFTTVYHLPRVEVKPGADLGDLYDPENPRESRKDIVGLISEAYIPTLSRE